MNAIGYLNTHFPPPHTHTLTRTHRMSKYGRSLLNMLTRTKRICSTWTRKMTWTSPTVTPLLKSCQTSTSQRLEEVSSEWSQELSPSIARIVFPCLCLPLHPARFLSMSLSHQWDRLKQRDIGCQSFLRRIWILPDTTFLPTWVPVCLLSQG